MIQMTLLIENNSNTTLPNKFFVIHFRKENIKHNSFPAWHDFLLEMMPNRA